MTSKRGIRVAFFLLSLAVSAALGGSTVVVAQSGSQTDKPTSTNTQSGNASSCDAGGTSGSADAQSGTGMGGMGMGGMGMGGMDMSSCPCRKSGGCSGAGGSCSLQDHTGGGASMSNGGSARTPRRQSRSRTKRRGR